MLRSPPPYFLGQVMPIQPRAPMARLNAGEWLVAKSPAGAQWPPARASAKNARTSFRSASQAGGKFTGSKRKAIATGFRWYRRAQMGSNHARSKSRTKGGPRDQG